MVRAPERFRRGHGHRVLHEAPRGTRLRAALAVAADSSWRARCGGAGGGRLSARPACVCRAEPFFGGPGGSVAAALDASARPARPTTTCSPRSTTSPTAQAHGEPTRGDRRRAAPRAILEGAPTRSSPGDERLPRRTRPTAGRHLRRSLLNTRPRSRTSRTGTTTRRRPRGPLRRPRDARHLDAPLRGHGRAVHDPLAHHRARHELRRRADPGGHPDERPAAEPGPLEPSSSPSLLTGTTATTQRFHPDGGPEETRLGDADDRTSTMPAPKDITRRHPRPEPQARPRDLRADRGRADRSGGRPGDAGRGRGLPAHSPEKQILDGLEQRHGNSATLPDLVGRDALARHAADRFRLATAPTRASRSPTPRPTVSKRRLAAPRARAATMTLALTNLDGDRAQRRRPPAHGPLDRRPRSAS